MLNPTTLNGWGNILMYQWDLYLQRNPLGLALLNLDYYDQLSNSPHLPKFHSEFEDDYMMFRFGMQTLDLMLRDIDHYRFEPIHLALSALIIVIGLTFNIFSLHELRSSFKTKNDWSFVYRKYLCNLDIEFSHMVINFVEFHCHIRVPEL